MHRLHRFLGLEMGIVHGGGHIFLWHGMPHCLLLVWCWNDRKVLLPEIPNGNGDDNPFLNLTDLASNP